MIIPMFWPFLTICPRFFAYEHRYEVGILDIKNGGLVARERPFSSLHTDTVASAVPPTSEVSPLAANGATPEPTSATESTGASLKRGGAEESYLRTLGKDRDKSRLVVVDPFIRTKVSPLSHIPVLCANEPLLCRIVQLHARRGSWTVSNKSAKGQSRCWKTQTGISPVSSLATVRHYSEVARLGA